MAPDLGLSIAYQATEPRRQFYLEGASTAASVGLDIGGTLCKVVFFEPNSGAVSRVPNGFHLDSPNAGGRESGWQFEERDQSPKNRKPSHLCTLSEETSAEETNLDRSGPSSYSCTEVPDRECQIGRMAQGVVAETKVEHVVDTTTNAERCREGTRRGAPEASERTPEAGERATTSGRSGFQSEAGAATDGRDHDGTNGVEDVENLWMSSHEPIVLPGKGTLHFKRFETWRVADFLSLTRTHSLVNSNKVIGATGGGARKFAEVFKVQAGIELRKEDELKCLLKGIDFLVRHAEDDSFEYELDSLHDGAIQRPLHSPEHSDDGSGDEQVTEPGLTADVSMKKDDSYKKMGSLARGIRCSSLTRLGAALEGAEESAYPYLVVNIGSGVSILRVDARQVYERVGGTSLGGSTFLGLVSALTGCRTFEEAIALAAGGDSTNVDMLVGDIYGGDYTEMGLAATVVASSFGKLVQPGGVKVAASPADLAKACLLMVTNNLGSLAMLHAKAAGVKRILFAGSFLHGNKVAMKLLSVAVEFWSKGVMKAVFLRHEGHAGAIGALLSGMEEGALL